jgi:hypothetical protein
MLRHRGLNKQGMFSYAVFALAASLICELGSAQTTVIGQFTGSALTWDDTSPNPCIGSTQTDVVRADCDDFRNQLWARLTSANTWEYHSSLSTSIQYHTFSSGEAVGRVCGVARKRMSLFCQ